jgi:hypothetical protein
MMAEAEIQNPLTRVPLFDWNKIVSTVVAFLITSLLMGFTALMGWSVKTQVDHIKILTRMETKQDADRRAQDKLVEFYARDIVELREEVVTLYTLIDEMERSLIPAPDDDDDPPPSITKAKPISRKAYENILKGHISRVREMNREQNTAPPEMEPEK